jgi:hypothetical protein
MSSNDPELLQRATDAYNRARRRDFSRSLELRRELEASTSSFAHVVSLALASQDWTLMGQPWEAPSQSELMRLASSSRLCAAFSVRICEQLEHAALLRFEPSELDSWLEVHQELANRTREPEAMISMEIASAWSAWLRGQSWKVAEPALQAQRESARSKVAWLVVESTALRSLAAEASGSLEEATDLARRASLMGRTEALPEAEYLANIVLARIRRLTGRPYLATRILEALGRYLPPVWHGWSCWEQVLSGNLQAADLLKASVARPRHPLCGAPAITALGSLRPLFVAASRGDMERYNDAAARLRIGVAKAIPLAVTVEALISLITGEKVGEDVEVTDWLEGRRHDVPRGLTESAFQEEFASELDPSLAYIVVVPDGARSLRLSYLGVKLVETQIGSALLPFHSKPQQRVEHGLALLALSRHNRLAIDEYVSKLYGLAYDKDVHGVMFGVHLHRLRERVGAAGSVVREGDTLRLDCHAPFLIQDPRCSRPLADRLLHRMAIATGASARELARQLDVPLRSVQRALQELVSEEACMAEAIGRGVKYRVEDTIFSEPTRDWTAKRSAGD